MEFDVIDSETSAIVSWPVNSSISSWSLDWCLIWAQGESVNLVAVDCLRTSYRHLRLTFRRDSRQLSPRIPNLEIFTVNYPCPLTIPSPQARPLATPSTMLSPTHHTHTWTSRRGFLIIFKFEAAELRPSLSSPPATSSIECDNAHVVFSRGSHERFLSFHPLEEMISALSTSNS